MLRRVGPGRLPDGSRPPETEVSGGRLLVQVVRWCVDQPEVPTWTVITPASLTLTTLMVVPVLGTSTLYQPGW